jgi:hypothetical protein
MTVTLAVAPFEHRALPDFRPRDPARGTTNARHRLEHHGVKPHGADADGRGVGPSDRARRRVKRLALAGVVWAACLVAIRTTIQLTAARAHSTPTEAVRIERGRLPRTVPGATATHSDSRLAHVVAVLAGIGADVRCWSTADWRRQATAGLRQPWRANTVGTPLLTVNLSPALCAELTRLTRLRLPVWRDEFPDALAFAVGTLAHESMHVSGIPDEAKAECEGMQTIAKAAVLLGRPPAEARYLAVLYARHWYPWWPSRYRSPECHDGGRLDLHPNTTVWP